MGFVNATSFVIAVAAVFIVVAANIIDVVVFFFCDAAAVFSRMRHRFF